MNTDGALKGLEGEVVRTEATEESPTAIVVYRYAFIIPRSYYIGRGSGANSFRTPCLVQGGSSVLQTAQKGRMKEHHYTEVAAQLRRHRFLEAALSLRRVISHHGKRILPTFTESNDEYELPPGHQPHHTTKGHQ